ncbi:arsenical-resistance protein [Cryptococcus neoformans C23]|uniref:Arsenical-resistance protein n=1 Tax=Cryptococcus neoformans (strain H99 / ATCC 208821 / CBS 10515 / FGSC 9487) TaxID=235443 RepID=J9VIA7_CRYN9|nr:arsenical-resistance protein [Cryptococcus neoformans var. grubii H99]AUB23797.1 arsenical-resistance protein [Cryptococcus neoformans var. grubii]OWZ45784.1 arsenical-resistance protein [Cryptococcus neoformans var. grubii C23]OWZ48501.1 arsenical-resistance protein [Cryptococcus neoformans var. grubii AD1-83a]OXG63631.1 arsenical-resistance protein [Cryptococcus neoformans var. grubii MW-RSA1955]OXG66634.1 arsenical-resistance protein [Cryptococcus neoformans var. grubii c8]OXG68655.1 ar|eukprot:XP_012048354.1 arsenical-resistance protein [Cryptococcus neoformans var. grubii H99]
MVQCHPLDSLSSAAGSSPHEKTPLVHPPMVCEDDCQCFKKNYFKKSYETIPAFNTSGIHADKREVGDIDLEGGMYIVKSLSFLDRFLALWILAAMILGVIVGEFAPNVDSILTGANLKGVSVPVLVGLLCMMWPILTKVQYERLPSLLRSSHIYRQIGMSLFLNWIVGPFVMLGIAWATLPDLPTYREGIILVGLARCIAMVMIWNRLAHGNEDYCAILVIINSILQIILYSPMSVFFINVISRSKNAISLRYGETAIAVLIYLGIPLGAGVLTRFGGLLVLGKKRFDSFLTYFGIISLIALLYTVIIIFAEQSHRILHNLGPTFRTFVPMILYFAIMWTSAFSLIWFLSQRKGGRIKWGYEMAVVQAFTAGSNNFELAIAVAVAVYGVSSDQALAATIGPLVEVPVLLALTWVALLAKKRLNWGENEAADETCERECGC